MYPWQLPPCSQRVSADAAHSGRTGRRDERSAQSAAMAWHTGTYLAWRRNGVDSCGSGRVIHLIDAARLHGPGGDAASAATASHANPVRHFGHRESRSYRTMCRIGVVAAIPILHIVRNAGTCSASVMALQPVSGVRVRTGAACGRDGGAIRSFASSWPPGRRREHGERNGHRNRGW
jgi:hypothetical protein